MARPRGIERLDALIGDGLERAVRIKHRRRLARLDSLHALEPQDGGWWAAGEPPPRPGCRLEVLIDGAEALRAIAEVIAAAERYVCVTGWHLEPSFELVREDGGTSIGALLADAAERLPVRVLVWAGSPVPLFHPTRGEVSTTIEQLKSGTRIQCHADPREHPFHCHHEKTIVVDGHTAFVGGIDLTDLAGDRYDTSDHPSRRRLGWHDVGTRLSGPAVADVAAHFALRWRELTGETLDLPVDADPDPEGQTVQVVRTVAEDMYDALPRGAFRILESYVRAIRNAERFVYLENQFLWSPEIVAHLAEKLRHPPDPAFRVVIVLPLRANNGQDDTSGQVGVLESADRGGHLLVTTLRSLSGRREDRLYVHAKVGIVDDRWLTVGSANLNAHSLFNDTEMNVVTDDRVLARATRLRLWAEHLDLDVAAIADEPVAVTVDERWRPTAFEQLERLRAGGPPTHHLMALPGVSPRSHRLLGPLSGLVDDG